MNTAIKLNPKSAKLYDLRGSFYIELKRYDDAIKDAKIAISLDSNYMQAYYGLILAYMFANKYDEAFTAINKTIKLKPPYIDMLYRFRASLFSLQGRYKEAIEDCNASIKINSDNAVVYNIRGQCYLVLKEYKKAIEDFDRAIELDPDNIDKVKQDAIEYKQKAYEALAEMGEKK
ncbi:tetratricopeptide repeat protein [Treponema putidum]|uniref:tetratricopeptide repeat protein n=1 Tax=Treponema putidum TaxID=221027 RepID=UPI003F6E4E40